MKFIFSPSAFSLAVTDTTHHYSLLSSPTPRYHHCCLSLYDIWLFIFVIFLQRLKEQLWELTMSVPCAKETAFNFSIIEFKTSTTSTLLLSVTYFLYYSYCTKVWYKMKFHTVKYGGWLIIFVFTSVCNMFTPLFWKVSH